MRFVLTDGNDRDFISLCHLLDANLDEIVGGRQNRAQYLPYNTLEDIRDVIVAYEDDTPIGCAGFKRYNEDTAEIKRVFVRPEYRKKGAASQILTLLETRAKEKEYRSLVLETGLLLQESMGLYRSLGFTVTENYGPYKGMTASVCMQKDIGMQLKMM
jgi:N-acetylglutamate synthase and related acetyltransferases